MASSAFCGCIESGSTQHSNLAHGLTLTMSGGSTPMLRHTTRATAVVFRRSFGRHLDTSPPFSAPLSPLEELARPATLSWWYSVLYKGGRRLLPLSSPTPVFPGPPARSSCCEEILSSLAKLAPPKLSWRSAGDDEGFQLMLAIALGREYSSPCILPRPSPLSALRTTSPIDICDAAAALVLFGPIDQSSDRQHGRRSEALLWVFDAR